MAPQTNDNKWSLCDFFAGWAGGVFGLTIGHPFDTLKVRQQTLPGKTSIWSLTAFTFRHEGVRGFFKGLSYPAFMSGIYTSVFFGVYGNSLRSLEDYRGTVPRRMCCEGGEVGPYWHQDVFVAGCLGGTAVVLISSPIDLIKIKLQSQAAQVNRGVSLTEPYYRGPWHAARTIYSKYGLFRGLYKGCVTMLWRDVWTFGLYMQAYEHILCMFKSTDDRSPDTSITSQIVAGGIAGILSWIVVMPLDVVKSRIQGDDFTRPKYRGMIHCIADIWKKEGIRSLFLGTTLVTIRAFPCNAATFVGYEFVIHHFCSK